MPMTSLRIMRITTAQPLFWEPFIFHSKSMAILPVIQILPLEHLNCSGLICFVISTIPIFQGTLLNSGEDGTFPFQPGFVIMCIFPLGGSKVNRAKRITNTFIIFLVSGFWHGAKWTFIVWGALNAFYFLPLLLTNKNRDHVGTIRPGKMWPGWRNILNISLTFTLTSLAWVFFRSDSVEKAIAYIKTLFFSKSFSVQYLGIDRYSPELLLLLSIFIFVEWISREGEHPMYGKLKTH